MAYYHDIKLTFGASSISLMGTNCVTTNYEMMSAKAGSVKETKDNPFGYGSVTEVLRLFLEDTTAAAVQTRYEDLDRFCQQAINQQREMVNTKLTFGVKLSTDADYWSSPVLDYSLTAIDGFMTSIVQGKLEVELRITREYYFEYSRVQLNLTSATEGPMTKPTINNSNQNYVYTSDSAVLGTLPAPVLARLYNVSGSSVVMKNVYIGVNANQNPTALQHIFQAESATSTTSGVNTSDAASSGGNYTRITYTSGMFTYFAWVPSTSVLNAMAGNMFRVFGRFKNAPNADLFMNLGSGVFSSPLYFSTWDNPEILNTQSRQIVDFGSIRMPHGNFANDLNYSSGFHLMANPISSGTWDLDFVCLMPATGVRHLKQIPSLNTVNNAYIADNSRDGEAYLYSSSVKYPVFEQYGSPLYVWPKKVNYLYFLTETTSGGASDPLLAMDVEVFYWPRRLTV